MAERVINKANNNGRNDSHQDCDDYPLWEQLLEEDIQGIFDRRLDYETDTCLGQ